MSHKAVSVMPPLSTSLRPADPTTIVLHATAGSTARSSVDWLRAQGLGYHYIIARDGVDTASTPNANCSDPAVFYCIDPKFRANHASSTVPMPGGGGHGANRVGVAISLANRQNGEAYTPKQLTVLDEIIQLVLQTHPTVKFLTTHAVIQPWNRRDPLNVNGPSLAQKHGLTWFQPPAAQTSAATPPKTPKPK